jgi:hypothetical protein
MVFIFNCISISVLVYMRRSGIMYSEHAKFNSSVRWKMALVSLLGMHVSGGEALKLIHSDS